MKIRRLLIPFLLFVATFTLTGLASGVEIFEKVYPAGHVPADLFKNSSGVGPGELGFQYNAGDLKGFSPNQGTMEFWVNWIRNGENGFYGRSFDPLFSFAGEPGTDLFMLAVEWGDGKHRPGLLVYNNAGNNHLQDMWGEEIDFGFEPHLGDWLHIVLTWDKTSENRSYINGVATGPVGGKILNPGKGTLGFSSFEKLIVGADNYNYTIYREKLPGWTASSSAFGGFALYDEPLTELQVADLYKSRNLRQKPLVYPDDVAGLSAAFSGSDINLSWEKVDYAKSYNLYRRNVDSRGSHLKITSPGFEDTCFIDSKIVEGETYGYTVFAVNEDGIESKDSIEVIVTAAEICVDTVAAEKRLYGAEQQIVVMLRGTPDCSATFSIAGLAVDVVMEEVDDGVYIGYVDATGSDELVDAPLTAKLIDNASGQEGTGTGEPVSLDCTAPEGIDRIIASAPWDGEIEVSWMASISDDVACYRVYRAVEADPDCEDEPFCEVTEEMLTDRDVTPGLSYSYAVTPVDEAGNEGIPSEVVSATAVCTQGPSIASIVVEPTNKPLKPGELVTVTLAGQSGASVLAEIDGLIDPLALVEEGATGRYQASFEIEANHVAETLGKYRLIAKLADDFGSAALAGPEVAVIGRDVLNDETAPLISKIEHDGFNVAGFSGALVAGNELLVMMEGEPGGFGSFDLSGITENVEMSEVTEGLYRGSYIVQTGDTGEGVTVVGHLFDQAGNETTAVAGKLVNVDTGIRLSVKVDDPLLPADQDSRTRMTVIAQDANGDGVEGHELAVTLSTTEEYTGVVGGGDIDGELASVEDVDDIEVKWDGITDRSGEVGATYTSGFAAKTALMVAKNLTTGDVGVGWINTYIASTLAIELTPTNSKGATDLARLFVSAEPNKLTADGRSRSRIRAMLTDLSGNPIPDAKLSFTLGNGNGKLKVLGRGETDQEGVARADYRAGTLMGTVTVTVAAPDYGVTGSINIILMSDAPAKLKLVASRSNLPADGDSEATVAFKVTDINDNPNSQVPVALSILEGAGELADNYMLTDRNGEGAATYVSGRRSGTVIIEARHTSRPPSDAELRRVYGTVFVPRLYERQQDDRMKVEEWLVEVGDEVEKDQPLVTVTTSEGEWTFTAREAGVLARRVKHEHDIVALGETLGWVEVDEELWDDTYEKLNLDDVTAASPLY